MVGVGGAGIVGLAAPWLAAPSAASDDGLVFAYFGVSAELLLADFYAKAARGEGFAGREGAVLRRSRSVSRRHAMALSKLLEGAAADVPTSADFVFTWPKRTFAARATTIKTGLTILGSVQGTYQNAAATLAEPTYRVLYASLAASSGQQIGVLRTIDRGTVPDAFPVSLDLETASNAIESYLG